MNYMIDTNIILDVMLDRKEFSERSRIVLQLCEDSMIHGFISSSTATDIFYLVRKALKSTDAAYSALGHILNITRVLTVTNNDITSAFLQKAHDFEDCLLATCARSNNCDGIITRNKKDFSAFDIPSYTPEEIISILSGNKKFEHAIKNAEKRLQKYRVALTAQIS